MGPLRCALCPQRGSNSRRGIVTRAAGEGPRDAGIDGQCESSHEAPRSTVAATILVTDPRRPRPCGVHAALRLRQRHALLPLIFAPSILVRSLADLVRLEEDHLCDAFV